MKCLAGRLCQNLFPIAFSQNGPLDMEKRDCCGLMDRPVLRCRADLQNGREWVGSRPAAAGLETHKPTLNALDTASETGRPFISRLTSLSADVARQMSAKLIDDAIGGT